MRSVCADKLRNMQVVNIRNGEILGFPTDFELTVGACLTVTEIVIKGSKGIFGIGKKNDIRIPWDAVNCIGEDAILVDLPGGCRNGCK